MTFLSAFHFISSLALVTQCLGAVMEMVTVVQTALILYLPSTQHRILTELMHGVVAIYNDHRNQLFQKFPEIIHAVAEKACSEIEVCFSITSLLAHSLMISVLIGQKQLHLLLHIWMA